MFAGDGAGSRPKLRSREGRTRLGLVLKTGPCCWSVSGGGAMPAIVREGGGHASRQPASGRRGQVVPVKRVAPGVGAHTVAGIGHG